ncbi:MAG: class I SAM-dependent methyltransferase [Proteobacteria bacterium]|nr:class I SAM-dependent methyltransferase [Pseudomonadota bacterium]
MTEIRKVVEPYDPDLYDLIHRGYADDVGFYRNACRGTKKILELGCGCGRITMELAREGLLVVGLDNHPGMLKLLETRRRTLPGGQNSLQLIDADMSDFVLSERFDRIIIPFNGLFCLLDEQAVHRCFSRILDHLTDEGRLIFDVYRVDPDDDLQQDRHGEFEFLTQVVNENGLIEVFERYIVDPAQQRIDAEYLYKIVTRNDDIEEVVCRIPQRYLLLQDIERLLAEAGLRTLDIKGGYHGEPPDEDHPIIVVEAGKRT